MAPDVLVLDRPSLPPSALAWGIFKNKTPWPAGTAHELDRELSPPTGVRAGIRSWVYAFVPTATQ